MTNRARYIHIGQKLHIKTDDTRTVTLGATKFAGVVRKVAGLESRVFGLRCSCKRFTQIIVHACIGGNGRTNVRTNGGGINQLNIFKQIRDRKSRNYMIE